MGQNTQTSPAPHLTPRMSTFWPNCANKTNTWKLIVCCLNTNIFISVDLSGLLSWCKVHDFFKNQETPHSQPWNKIMLEKSNRRKYKRLFITYIAKTHIDTTYVPPFWQYSVDKMNFLHQYESVIYSQSSWILNVCK